MFQLIYRLPLLFLTLVFLAACLLWSVLNYTYSLNQRKFCKYIWITINVICFAVITFLIIHNTLISRYANNYILELTPFYSFAVAKIKPEMWRQLFMNIILFIPFGMSLSCIIVNFTNVKRTITTVTLSGAVLSLLIELLQYFFHLGEAWTDDVICNLLGAFLGSLVVTVPSLFKNK